MVSAIPPDRRELASQLRQLRERAQLSTTTLGTTLGWSQSKVSKIELGRTKPSIADVRAWLDAVDAPAGQRADLLDLAESVQVASVIWNRTLPGGRAGHQRGIGQLRDRARATRIFQNGAIPGLLQTADYARRILTLADVFGLGDTARTTATRIEHQTILYEEGRAFEFIITEAALRFHPGPSELLTAQYDRILSVATLPSVTLSVLPTNGDSSTVHIHPFVIYEQPDDTATVTVETYTRELTLTDPEEVRYYRKVYDTLRTDALHGDQARDFLGSLRHQTASVE